MKKYIIIRGVKDNIDTIAVQADIVNDRLFPTLESAQEALANQICEEIRYLTEENCSYQLGCDFCDWAVNKNIPNYGWLEFENENGDFVLSISSNYGSIIQDDDEVMRVYRIYELDTESDIFIYE